MNKADPPVSSFMNPGEALNRVTDWPGLFELIRTCPGMWLGRASITLMHRFIDGIRFAEVFHKIPEEKRLGGFPFDEFEDWIAEEYNPERMTLRSFDLAHRGADSDEEAFSRWFTWYDRFRRDRADP